MNAVISGRAAVALAIEGQQLYSIHYDAIDDCVERDLGEWSLLLGGVDDIEFVEDCDEDTVRGRLEDAVDRTEALDLVLYLLDDSLSDEVRRTASLELNELLVYPEIVTYLESILYAKPLPESADPEGARRCCDAPAAHAQRLIDSLIEHQDAIDLVRCAFEATCPEALTDDRLSEVESAYLRAGTFAHFAKSGGDSSAITQVWMSTLQDQEISRSIGVDVLRTTLTAWANNLRELWSPESQQEEKAATAAKRSEWDDEPSQQTQGKRQRQKRYNREQAKINVDLQKERAVELLRRRKFAQARQVINQVVQYNLENGGPEYACKTLYSLAKEAQELGLPHLQLDLTERSIAIDPDDGWSWTQHGKALLDVGKLNKALNAYDRALELTNDVEPKTGRAEVLKAQGKLDEALEAFEQVSRQHPENVVAKTGRAEVLKAQGKLAEALEAFEQASRQHPENVVAKNGRAEVLKAQGKLDEALEAFEQVSRQHPENVIAKNGRAEVLKAQGKLAEALEAFEQVSRQHPEDAFAKNGRAEVLKAQGKLDEALEAFEQVSRQHPENVVAKNGRAEVLKAQGKLAEALEAFEQVSRQHPENVVAKNGRAEVLKAQGKLAEALEAFEQVSRQHPEDAFAKNGRAEVLKAQGKLDEALEAYEQVSQQHPENVVAKNGRAEGLKAQGKLEEALEAYDAVCGEHPEDRVARNGRACVLAQLQRWDEGLAELSAVQGGSRDDWIGLHIRGVMLLKTEQFAAAREIFERGVAECPFFDSLDYFRAGQCLVDMTEGQFATAVERLEQVREPALQRPVTLFRVHSLGAGEHFADAAKVYETAAGPISDFEREISDELRARYIDRVGPHHDDPWLLDREIRWLLAA